MPEFYAVLTPERTKQLFAQIRQTMEDARKTMSKAPLPIPRSRKWVQLKTETSEESA